MCARSKRRWSVPQRDALGIVVLSLLVVLGRTLFAPAPINLPFPASVVGDFGAAPVADESNTALFLFDPNTLDSAGFVQLGFSPSQTRSLLRYRASGVVFRKPEDFSRSYAVSDQMYQKLLPYISIEPTRSPQAEKPSASRANAAPSSGTPFPATSPKEAAQPVIASPATPPKATALPVTASLTAPLQRELIEINSADTSRLQKIRGIGPYYAQKIVQYRQRLGGFAAMEQLMEIEGIDEARFEMMKPQIEIDYDLVRTIDLKSADQTTLGQHPYIGAYAARWIVHYRQQLGDTVCTLPSLLRRNIIKEQQAKWLEYYVE